MSMSSSRHAEKKALIELASQQRAMLREATAALHAHAHAMTHMSYWLGRGKQKIGSLFSRRSPRHAEAQPASSHVNGEFLSSLLPIGLLLVESFAPRRGIWRWVRTALRISSWLPATRAAKKAAAKRETEAVGDPLADAVH